MKALETTRIFYFIIYAGFWRYGGLMASALDSGSSGLDTSPVLVGDCVCGHVTLPGVRVQTNLMLGVTL